MRELHMIVDLQYGSCGKGLLAGYLGDTLAPDTIITAWSPNSGHTYIDRWGTKMMNTVLPNGIVSPNLKRILLGPGSVIDANKLWDELNRYDGFLDNVEIMIHECAAVVGEHHRKAEREYGFGIGSTMKGVGEAVIEKIRRKPESNIIARDVLVGTPLEGLVVPASVYNDAIDDAQLAVIEGSQGFSLSMNQGFYPFTTSRDCTVHQLLSDCAIPAGMRHVDRVVHGVARTYPIRVANRYDDKGNQIGWSGPCYDDQEEIEWGRLGIEPELTTVTQLPRRIFTWSHEQIKEAVRMNGIDDVFLNFVNYINMDASPGAMRLADYRQSIETAGASVKWLGVGPSHGDVVAE